jgi:hypothetical protein
LPASISIDRRRSFSIAGWAPLHKSMSAENVAAVASGAANMDFPGAFWALFIPRALSQLVLFGRAHSGGAQPFIARLVGLLQSTLWVNPFPGIRRQAADRTALRSALWE